MFNLLTCERKVWGKKEKKVSARRADGARAAAAAGGAAAGALGAEPAGGEPRAPPRPRRAWRLDSIDEN